MHRSVWDARRIVSEEPDLWAVQKQSNVMMQQSFLGVLCCAWGSPERGVSCLYGDAQFFHPHA